MSDPLPYAALDQALSQARYLLLQFDGPVCDLYARQPDEAAADLLRAVLASHGAHVPDNIRTTADPLAVLDHAQTVSDDLARHAEAELTRHELDVIQSAVPAAYADDVISSARNNGRTVAIIGTCSTEAMHAYLTSESLDELVGIVIGRTPYTTTLTDHDLIAQALSTLAAGPAQCALVAQSESLIDAASSAGVATIAYAPTRATRELPTPRADVTFTSLADLVLRLRARPLPN
jgi:beta-phosphoglucomutase-like phosphatase (HAD superfamily)